MTKEIFVIMLILVMSIFDGHLEKLISTAAKRCKSLLGNFPQQLLRIHLNRMVFSIPTIPNAAGKGQVPQPRCS